MVRITTMRDRVHGGRWYAVYDDFGTLQAQGWVQGTRREAFAAAEEHAARIELELQK